MKQKRNTTQQSARIVKLYVSSLLARFTFTSTLCVYFIWQLYYFSGIYFALPSPCNSQVTMALNVDTAVKLNLDY